MKLGKQTEVKLCKDKEKQKSNSSGKYKWWERSMQSGQADLKWTKSAKSDCVYNVSFNWERFSLNYHLRFVLLVLYEDMSLKKDTRRFNCLWNTVPRFLLIFGKRQVIIKSVAKKPPSLSCPHTQKTQRLNRGFILCRLNPENSSCDIRQSRERKGKWGSRERRIWRQLLQVSLETKARVQKLPKG